MGRSLDCMGQARGDSCGEAPQDLVGAVIHKYTPAREKLERFRSPRRLDLEQLIEARISEDVLEVPVDARETELAAASAS